MKLSEGMIVKISENSEYYDSQASPDSDNPTCLGFIKKVYNKYSHCYDVQWDNGEYNCYKENDLELA